MPHNITSKWFIFHYFLSSGRWFLPLRWWLLMPDSSTWDLTWVHPCPHMPVWCLGELSLEQVSTVRSTFIPQRFQSVAYKSILTASLFVCYFLSWLWLFALRAHGNSCPATGAHTQAKYSQVVHAEYYQHLKILYLHNSVHHVLQRHFIHPQTFKQVYLFIITQVSEIFVCMSLLRMEMNAILHQKELENAHQKGLMGIDNPMSYPSNPMAFRGRQRMPDGHDVYVHRPTLDELHSNSIIMSASPYPPISMLHRERGRRAGRRPTAHKSVESHVSNLKGQAEDKSIEESPGATSGEEKEVETKGDIGEECAASKTHHQAKIDTELAAGSKKNYKEGEPGLRKACVSSQDGCSDGPNSSTNDKDMSSQCSAFQEKFVYPPTGGALTGMPYMFPVSGNGFLPPGKFRKLYKT